MIPVAAAVIGGIGLPLVGAVAGEAANEGVRLVTATERSRNKAHSLQGAFTEVIPPAAAASLPAQPDGTPEPAQYRPNIDHAVVRAMTTLANLQRVRDSCPPDSAPTDCRQPLPMHFETAIENLHNQWSPRYQRAVDEHERFRYRVERTEAAAADYFTTQRELTAQLPADQQERWRANDNAEYRVYLDWRDQAYDTLGQADLIMVELRTIEPDHHQTAALRPVRRPVRLLPDHAGGDQPALRGAGPLPSRIGPYPGHLRRRRQLSKQPA